jgi:hypothetical protein
MRPSSRTIAVLFLSLIITACSDDSPGDPSAGLFDRPDPTSGITDQEIWDASYGDVRLPPGFYTEELDGSLYYMNSISITPLEERENAWYELCTEDAAQARTWSDLTIGYGSGRDSVISEKSTEKYFDILRTGGSHSVHYRAHRCSYLDQTAVDRFQLGSFRGYFMQRPVTPDAVRELVEYLWFIRHDKIGGQSVLRSTPLSGGSAVRHVLITVHLLLGDWDVKDIIRIEREVYSVDTATGEILVETTLLEEFTGKQR